MLTGYKDPKGKEYKVGDIVLNPLWGDLWIVGKYSDSSKMEKYEKNCSFFFCLRGDPDNYFMDITDTHAFIIIDV